MHQVYIPNEPSHRHDHDGHSDRADRERRHPGHYPWGYSYVYDYGTSYTEQQSETPTRENKAEIARLEEERQDDERRQRELDRQLADQRAADATGSTLRYLRADASSGVTEREPTLLIYKDQHQGELRNYAIVGDTIYDFGPQGTRIIALSDIDIPATIAANDERGVDFKVPANLR